MLQRLRGDADYRARFARAFGPAGGQISYARLIQAIATFQRGVVSANSRYDQSLAGQARLSDSEARGRALFFSERAQCASCHQPDGSGVEGMFPPLAKRLAPWLALPAGREYVAQVMMNGRFGQRLPWPVCPD